MHGRKGLCGYTQDDIMLIQRTQGTVLDVPPLVSRRFWLGRPSTCADRESRAADPRCPFRLPSSPQLAQQRREHLWRHCFSDCSNSFDEDMIGFPILHQVLRPMPRLPPPLLQSF